MPDKLSKKPEADSYAEYERKMLLFENGPTTTNFQQLIDKGVELPEPDSVSDTEIRSKLWEVLAGLHALRVYLDHTDHLSDRELYVKLWNDTLRCEVPAIDEIGFNSHVQVLLCSGEEPETSLYLRYFADDTWRTDWQKDNPDYDMPPHETPPFNRDALIPSPDYEGLPEAGDWLRANWGPSAFATNRFGPTSHALEFVDQLYATGATMVAIDNIVMPPDHAWTPYADTLIVVLPDDPARRRELFELMKHIGRPDQDGPDPIEELFIDSGQRSVRLWWD
jgi:hypothetical protein